MNFELITMMPSSFQSRRHLTGNAFPLAPSYLETLRLKSLMPLATARVEPEGVEVQYIDPAVKPVVKAHILFR